MKTIVLLGILALSPNVRAQLKTVESLKEKTSVTYHLDHPLHTMEAISHDAVFRAEIDSLARRIRSVAAQVDVMTFDSGNSNRDSHAMEVIDAITYPEASFQATGIDSAGGDSLRVAGTLTFHGVTKEVVATVVQSWGAEELDVEGNFSVSLTAFNIDRPSLLMMPVSDTLRFFLKTAFPVR